VLTGSLRVIPGYVESGDTARAHSMASVKNSHVLLSLVPLEISSHIEQIIRDKYISHETDIIKLIDSEDSIDIVSIFHLKKTKRDESIFKERNICTNSGSAFIYVHKNLKIRNKYQDEKRLFKGIFNVVELLKKYIKLLREQKIVI
jgi:hypothetical protein